MPISETVRSHFLLCSCSAFLTKAGGSLCSCPLPAGVYSTDPPAPGLYDRYVPPAKYHAEIASVPRPTFVTKPEGDCYIETYMVRVFFASVLPQCRDRWRLAGLLPCYRDAVLV